MPRMRAFLLCVMLCVSLIAAAAVFCQTPPPQTASAPTSAPVHGYNLDRFPRDGWAKMPDEWFRSEQAGGFAANIIAWQLPYGGWHKTRRMHLQAPDPNVPPLRAATFDNGATMAQMHFLGNMVRVTGDPSCREAFLRGVDFMLAAQLPCGGWPQEYPNPWKYRGQITYNDGAMIGVMTVLRDVAEGKHPFVDADRVERCRQAVDRGVECILKTQVVVDGKPTIWAQQHDPSTFVPGSARAYELPFLAPAESSGIVQFLMELDPPSPQVRRAVHAAVAWMKQHAVTGLRYEHERDVDAVVVPDPSAEPLWARFYDQATGKPVFVGRDSIPKDSLDQIESERRSGYRWYGRGPARVLKGYEAWCAEHGEKPVD